MAADQKIEMELALRDSVSVTLKAISQNLDNVNRKLTKGGEGITEGVDALHKIKVNTEGFSNTAKHGTDTMSAFSLAMLKVLPGLAASGPLATIGAVVGAGVALGKFGTDQLRNAAAARLQLKNMATDTGLTEEKIDILRQYGTRKGIAQEDTDKYITNVAQGIKDMASLDTNAPLFQRLDNIGETELAWQLLKMAKRGGDVGPALDKAMRAIDNAANENHKRRLAEAFQSPVSFAENYDEGMKGLTAAFKMSLDKAKAFLVETNELYRWTGSVSTALLDFSLRQATRALEVTEQTNKMLNETIRPDIRDQAERKRLHLPDVTTEELDRIAEAKKQRGLLDDILRSLKLSADPNVTPRQFGGLVQAGRPYRVGEQGPELFSTADGRQQYLLGEHGPMLFRPHRSGNIDPFAGSAAPFPHDPMGTTEENYDALNRALKGGYGLGAGTEEGEPIPNREFGGFEVGNLRAWERNMEERLALPWGGTEGQAPHEAGPRGGPPGQFYNPSTGDPQGQPISLDGALGGGVGVGLDGEISFKNVPHGVTTKADGDGFDNFTVNKSRQLEQGI